METLNILLVDDDRDVGFLLKRRIQKEAPHFSIDSVEGGRECLEYLKAKDVDCVLSDYQMPGMSGMELLGELRRAGHDVPFIFVTGQGNEDVAREAFKNGAYDYFTKDINGFAYFTRVANSVEQAVRQRRWAAEILRRAAEGFSHASGDEFFRVLVMYLGETLGADYVFVGELTSEDERVIETRCVYARGKIAGNFSYSLDKTPCENVVDNRPCIYPREVQRLFPEDEMLVQMGIESYAGAPLFGSGGGPIGILVAVHTKPFENLEFVKSLLLISASRASVELERLRAGNGAGSSDSVFRRMVDESAFGVAVVQDEAVVYASPRFVEMTGCGPDCPLDGVGVPEHDQSGVARDLLAEMRRLIPGRAGVFRSRVRCNVKGSGAEFELVCSPTVYGGRPAVIGIALAPSV